MDNSQRSHPNLLDLPNEILLIILNKLDMVDVFYSLVGVSGRLDQLVFHPSYIRHVNMTSIDMRSMFTHAFSIENQVLERICKNVLPRMRHQSITEVTVEQGAMDHLLQTINYSQICALSLFNCSEQAIRSYLTGKWLRSVRLNSGSSPSII